jgi:hypothetical protein
METDPLVAYDGHQWRLRSDGSLRRWDVGAGGWVTMPRERWSEEDAAYLTRMDEAGERAADDDDDVAGSAAAAPGSTVEGCMCLGGTLPWLCLYGKYTLVFERGGILLRSPQGGTTTLPLEEVVNVGVGGRGRVDGSTHARPSFAGAGASEGMAPAAVVSSLVLRTGMDTSITIETMTGKAVFHCERLEPEQARVVLSPVTERLERRRRTEATGRVNATSDLIALAGLKERGLLTDQEFASAVDAALQGKL